jgi:hypothetical protein
VNAVWWAVLASVATAVVTGELVYVLLRAQLDDRGRRIATLRNSLTNITTSFVATERERDGFADALAGVLVQAGRGDLEGVVAHARQALDGGDYHGRLRAAQAALEAAERDAEDAAEQADLLLCSCMDEAGEYL